jgi:hypothetical protein
LGVEVQEIEDRAFSGSDVRMLIFEPGSMLQKTENPEQVTTVYTSESEKERFSGLFPGRRGLFPRKKVCSSIAELVNNGPELLVEQIIRCSSLADVQNFLFRNKFEESFDGDVEKARFAFDQIKYFYRIPCQLLANGQRSRDSWLVWHPGLRWLVWFYNTKGQGRELLDIIRTFSDGWFFGSGFKLRGGLLVYDKGIGRDGLKLPEAQKLCQQAGYIVSALENKPPLDFTVDPRTVS